MRKLWNLNYKYRILKANVKRSARRQIYYIFNNLVLDFI
jgi:hypothetical protein